MRYSMICLLAVFCILFVLNYSNIYEGRHLNELCAYLSIKFQVMYA